MCSRSTFTRITYTIAVSLFCGHIFVDTVDLHVSNGLDATNINYNKTSVFKVASTNIYGLTSNVSTQCGNSSHTYVHGKVITYYQHELLLLFGHCATFSEKTKILSYSKLPLDQLNSYNIYNMSTEKFGYIILPRNLSQLNDYMCGPLNRKGLVCSQCADGFGPSITSFGYKCVNCTDAWYRVPLFLLLEFAPITVLYLIVLVFQISVTSPPMPCFIMCAQLMILAIKTNHHQEILLTPITFNEAHDFRLDMKVVLTLYGIFNLDPFHFNILPPLCLSTEIKFIDLEVLEYLAAFYPILLIILTCVCVELHGRNFRPLVVMWRPFHKCFVRLRREWNAKNDLVDVFITFFILSYNKLLVLILLLLQNKSVIHITESGMSFTTHLAAGTDNASHIHILFSTAAIAIGIIYNIFPVLLLVVYTFRTFRSCLSKMHLDFIAVNTFVDKVYGCYRDGLAGGRDMRGFASLYFFLRIAAIFVTWLPSLFLKTMSSFYFTGILFSMISLLVALAKPYKKSYMNYLDIIFLFSCSVMCHTIALQSEQHGLLLMVRIMQSAPLLLLILYVMIRIFHGRVQIIFKGTVLPIYGIFSHHRSTDYARLGNQASTNEIQVIDDFTAASPAQPLIEPTCTVVSYGTIENNLP